MSDYIVILNSRANDGMTIDHIDGFETTQHAEAAGKTWAESMRKHGGQHEYVVVTRPSAP